MNFSELKVEDIVYILEVVGTFNSTAIFNRGVVTLVSQPYEEPYAAGQFPMPGLQRKKLIDVTISCNGESKKLAVQADLSTITDANIGLTVSTTKDSIVALVKQRHDKYKAKLEAVMKYEEEMNKCKDILDVLNAA